MNDRYKYIKYKKKYKYTNSKIQYGGNDNKITFTDKKILDILRKMCFDLDKLFTENNLVYWIDSGTLLGAVRHQDIIPWDDDCDIVILEENLNKLLNLKEKINKLGYDIIFWKFVYKIFPLNGDKINSEFNFPYKFPFVDIFVFKKENDKYIGVSDLVRATWPNGYYNLEEVFPLKRYKFNNFTLMGPNNPIPYLDRLYGKDWNTIVKKWYDHANEKTISMKPIELKNITF